MRKLTYTNVIFLGVIFLGAIFTVAQQPATRPGAHSQYGPQSPESADKIWAELMEGNKRFVSGRLKPEHVVRDRKLLTDEQHSKVMMPSITSALRFWW